jgi:hypothetical protein
MAGCRDAPPVDRVGHRLLRADLPEVLAELAARYELAWATAWQDNANLLLAPALGLPALPVIRFTDPAANEPGLRHAGRTWKLPSVQRFAADRPLAWIDTELHGDAYEWAAARRTPTKLLSTDPSHGIVDREVRSLFAFARRARLALATS